MGVFAHPDDEQGVSGVMLKYGREGINTTLICATRGEAGEIAPGTGATPETLGEVREREMRCAAETVEVKHLYFLDYCDSGMAGTPINEDPMSFHQADLMHVVEKVVRIVREQKPQVMLTFDPWGGYGHPDHIKIHQAALIAYYTAGDARMFPHHMQDDGLQPWMPRKLYYGVFTRSRFQAYLEYAEQQGQELPDFARDFLSRMTPDDCANARIDVSEFVDLKWKSLLCHATQLGPDSPFAKMPVEMRKEGMRLETFMLAESRIGRPKELETDLFEGVRPAS